MRERVGDGQVICGLSGGVDSSVVAALLHRRDRRRSSPAIFVDNGLLRKDEAEQVVHEPSRPLQASTGPRRRCAPHASSRPRRASTDPEQKRKIIGHVFIEVFDDEARRPRKGVALPRPGHALPGRHRVGVSVDGPVGDDQDPPQRGRTARGAGVRADRAPARPVQGRGPPARPRAGPPGRARSGATPSPARASPSGCLGEVTPERIATSSSEADAIFLHELREQRLGTATPARPSRCCCPSRAWA